MAAQFFRDGLRTDSIRIPLQALLEFLAVVTGTNRNQPAIMATADARREAEELLAEFTILYPNDAQFRTALYGMAAYQLSWSDAQLWAYAEHYGLQEIVSEGFENGRLYGTVRVRNPFVSPKS